jgi:hypothetical protein
MSLSNVRIGPIEARIDPLAVRAYARATAVAGLDPEDDGVPATFPAVWLWHPAARAAVADIALDGRSVPVLMAQRFEYLEKLEVGETYRFEIERLADAGDPDIFQIAAHVSTLAGQRVAEFAATYRLFDLDGAAA